MVYTKIEHNNVLNTIHLIGISKTNTHKNAIEVLRNVDMYVFGVGGY